MIYRVQSVEELEVIINHFDSYPLGLQMLRADANKQKPQNSLALVHWSLHEVSVKVRLV